MSEKWTDKLPSLMEGYKEAAPEGLWDAVRAGALPKRRFAPWLYAAGGLVAAAAVALAVFLWRPVAVEPSVVSSVVPGEVPSVVPGEVLAETLTETAAEPVREQNEPQTFTEVPEQPVREQNEPETLTNVPEQPIREQNAPQTFTEVPDSFTEKPKARTKSRRKRVELQLSTGAYLAQAASLSSGYGIPYSPGMDTKADSPSPTVPMLSRNRPSTTEGSHRQSLRLSLGVSYAFAPRWSVGSGLTYTALRSDYATTSGNTVTYATRHLYYLGVPLQMQFNALEWKRLSVFVSAGALFETAVGSRLNTRAFIGEQQASESQQFPSVKDLRWSLTAGAGVQYQLFRYGALFLQPGFSWHIPNGGDVESYYSLHPCSFDLTFGYRFTL